MSIEDIYGVLIGFLVCWHVSLLLVGLLKQEEDKK
jgi:hypothetical protein